MPAEFLIETTVNVVPLPNVFNAITRFAASATGDAISAALMPEIVELN